MRELIVKSAPAEFKVDGKSDPNYYRVTGYASTFGNVDSYGDIIQQGAFAKSIAERFPTNKVKVLWEHYDPFGMPDELYEDSKGLYSVTRVPKSLSVASDRMALVEEGVVDSFSVGFTIPPGGAVWADYYSIRSISEVVLYEYSFVVFPANELAAIESIQKHAQLSHLAGRLDKDKVLAYAKTFEGVDMGRVDNALDVLIELSRKGAPAGEGEVDRRGGVPGTEGSSVEMDQGLALKSFAEELQIETALSSFRRGF